VAGCCEYGDERSGSGVTEVGKNARNSGLLHPGKP
jgi:hypothetical protein